MASVMDDTIAPETFCAPFFTESQRSVEPFARMNSHDEEVDAFVLESCNSTWLFDTERMRFRRVLKGADFGRRPATTEWRPYFGLDLDPGSESFVVLLNAEGTRLLRSWRHTHHCTECGGQATVELSLDELRHAG
jgi:hypothetical protein